MNKIKRRTYPPIRSSSPSVLGQFLDDTAGFSQITMAKWIVELVLTLMSVFKDFAHIKMNIPTSTPGAPTKGIQKEFFPPCRTPQVLLRQCGIPRIGWEQQVPWRAGFSDLKERRIAA